MPRRRRVGSCGGNLRRKFMSSCLKRTGDRTARTRHVITRSGGGAMALALVAYALAGSLSLTVHAGQSRAVTAGVYTEAQATRGQALFKEKCVICHDATLKGGLGPPLTGDAFMAVWGNQPLSDLVNKVQKTMPQNDPGKLTREQTVDLVAHILQVGKFPTGSAPLSQDDAVLAEIRLPAPPAAA